MRRRRNPHGPPRSPKPGDGRAPVAKADAAQAKEIAAYASALKARLGAKVFSEADTVDAAEGPEYNVVFVDGRMLALVVDERE